MHLLNEGALANDSSDQVEREGGGILPVAGHHFANGDFLLLLQRADQGVIGFLDIISVAKRLLDL